MSMQRKTAIASQPTETLLDSTVVDDRLYNPLVHWDYFSTLENPFVTLEQVAISGNNPAHKTDIGGQENISIVKGNEGKRDVRRQKLRSFIASSELSFVISLLSSRWSKSSLGTRVLSYTSSTDNFCNDLLETPTAPPAACFGVCGDFPYLKIHESLQRFQVLHGWKPCCCLRAAPNFFDWTCSTCGFSALLYQARYIDQYTERKISQHEALPGNAAMSIELLSKIQEDPILSIQGDLKTLETESATADFLEGIIQSALSDQLLDQEINTSCEINIVTIDQRRNFIQVHDYFGNTALHHAAAAQNFEGVLILLNIGVPAAILNTSGQSFLHLLEAHRDLDRYLDVLRRLTMQPTPFPFFHRDNYGSSIAHNFLVSTRYLKETPVEQLSEVHSILGVQSFGSCRSVDEGFDLELDFFARFANTPPENWVSGDKDLAIEIDKNGFTCLLAILREWPNDQEVTILLNLIYKLTRDREIKANVNACNSCGTTALAFAAGRGIYAAVEALLDLGANPNATMCTESGWVCSILHWTIKQRRKAKMIDDNTLYAALLECEKLLVSRGALREVDATVEFRVQSVK
jgi:ankyrin repeat protein